MKALHLFDLNHFYNSSGLVEAELGLGLLMSDGTFMCSAPRMAGGASW